jgi:CRP/FNR family cyclic AMP-dependent transcriptional regulator
MAITGHQKFNARTFLNTAGKGRTIENYRRNQIVFAQGDASNAVFHIHKGKVKVAVVSKQGKEAVSAVLGPGEFFGEGCISGQARRAATVTAMTEANIMRVEKLEFIRVLKDEHTLSDTFISHLVARTIRTEADLVDQLFNSSEKRLARLLLILANFGNDTPPEPIIAKISQETLADMIGTTRSRVSFFMNKFRRLGYIDYHIGRIEVKKALLNSVLHDHPQIRP